MGGEEIEVELDQRRAGFHLVTHLHPRPKALALQSHGIDADVQQNLRAFRRAQRHRMTSGVQRDHFAVTGREQHRIRGVD